MLQASCSCSCSTSPSIYFRFLKLQRTSGSLFPQENGHIHQAVISFGLKKIGLIASPIISFKVLTLMTGVQDSNPSASAACLKALSQVQRHGGGGLRVRRHHEQKERLQLSR